MISNVALDEIISHTVSIYCRREHLAQFDLRRLKIVIVCHFLLTVCIKVSTLNLIRFQFADVFVFLESKIGVEGHLGASCQM